MATLGKMWAGRIFGTNTGNFFLEIDSTSDGHLTGTFRLMDTLAGLTVYRIAGSFDGTTLRFEGASETAQAGEGVRLGSVRATAKLNPQGNLRGMWESSIGTAGTFEAYPHDQPVPDQRQPAILPPEQLYTATRSVGAVRLYTADLWELVEFVRQDFRVGRPVITYTIRGNEISQYLEDFQKQSANLSQLRRFKVVIQEPEAYGINKVVTVELTAFGNNEVRAQGINELWVTGKAEATARMLRKFENTLVTNYKKFGLTFNQVTIFVMLAFVPAIPLTWQRLVFVLIVLFLLQAWIWLYHRVIPNAVIYLSDEQPSALQRAWPTIWSFVSGIVASLVAAWLFRWFTGA